MGKRGSSSGVQRYRGGGGLNPGDILDERDMFDERNALGENGDLRKETDDALATLEDITRDFADADLANGLLVSTLKGKAANSTLGYYDGTNVAVNDKYFNEAMEQAYQECVKIGFHPSSGSKTGLQAVIAHELGHALTDAVGRKMGLGDIDAAAERIVKEARKSTSHRGVVQMAAKISRYATATNAETIAEAVSDVYCNGAKAAAESRAVVDTLRRMLK